MTLTLQDAVRLSGPLNFGVVIKPAGAACNLNCTYCYYLEKQALYPGGNRRMTEETLERVLRSVILAHQGPELTLHWHGGEPLLMGLDFFRKAIELEERFAGGRPVHNTIQTNGLLLTPEWADFLAGNDFLTGISIDGPEDLHNAFRKDQSGAPSFDKVLRGVALLREAGAAFNTLSTINRRSEGRGREVYRFLKSIGSRYMQFNPVAEQTPWSVGADAFGQFLCDIFDEWVRQDVGRCFVGQFDATLARWCGMQPGICSFSETCGDNIVIEYNADVYSCDHFVHPRYLLGNLLEQDLPALLSMPSQVDFGLQKREGLGAECQRCEWRFACNGGCPQHRFSAGKNALCAGYRRFFAHVAPYMATMRRLLQSGRPPADIMHIPAL